MPVQFFRLFATGDIIKMMVTETNRYAEQVLAQIVVNQKSRIRCYVATTAKEMKRFLEFVFATGLQKWACIEDHLSTDPVLVTPTGHSIMP